MATYTNQRPVKITADGNDEKYFGDHVTHFFNTTSYEIINALSQVDKERFFKMLTDHESLIHKLYGEPSTNSVLFLPASARKNINKKLINEYKVWLEKQ